MSTTSPSTAARPRPEAAQNAPATEMAGPARHWPEGTTERTSAQRAWQRMRSATSELRFVSERPPSLLEHVAYAQRGEWTEEIDGGRRLTALVFAWLVAVPVSTAAYFTAWAAARPGRFVSVVAVGLLVSTALAQVPGLGALIPDWARL